jgi:DNA-binding beta-propeller fold protein YncE
VADYFSNSVTELLRSNGKVVRVVDSSLKQPGGIACSGGHVWVTNGPRNSVTELQASNGSLVRVIK